jgi:hypothetical protein
MVKSIKYFPFSIAQKISEEDSIVWLKESNKYIILNSAILALIKKKNQLYLPKTLLPSLLNLFKLVVLRR